MGKIGVTKMTISLLLVDDHTVVRKALLSLFKECSSFCVVAVTDNGDHAVDLVRQHYSRSIMHISN